MILTQRQALKTVLAPAADRFASNPATSTVKLALFAHATFLVLEGAGGTGTATIEVEACSAADGSGAEAIPFRYRISTDAGATFGALEAATASGVTPAAGANKVTAVEVRARELPEGKPWVRLQLTEVVDSPVAGTVLAVLSEPRYAEDVMPSPS